MGRNEHGGEKGPVPVWDFAPRMAPGLPIPPHRVPAAAQPLPPELWRMDEGFLYAVDLYHKGFLSQARSQWEALRDRAIEGSAQAMLFEALAANAAALDALTGKDLDAALPHCERCLEAIRLAAGLRADDRRIRFMGLDLKRLADDMESCHGPILSGGGRAGKPPRLPLSRVSQPG